MDNDDASINNLKFTVIDNNEEEIVIENIYSKYAPDETKYSSSTD